ncbi:glucose-6-phosphate isomerase [Buchnera aphidicola (Brachycaudus cardui)]|uniref:Glucose-6-phosphate isomerase n=1 Tax=Buchnera aphidicola (Brachycaudus cardui) TaxID=557993 RepID=A0A4D6Y417_9GAMM|nr:glucose-6-phosphate isomerase [Buchnera aphidicola]QCI20691.1 glucose-6-phosphate isomerase [Buchnera aphidicola (Brachycaudus cardui)]
MKNINFNNTQSYKDLKNHFKKIKNVHLRDLFSSDINRFKKFSILFKNQILIDFSKNRINDNTLMYLLNLARETNVKSVIKEMFSGVKINQTEDRSVLHIALRNRSNMPIIVNNSNIMLEINAVLEKMKYFSNDVISGKWKGYTGKTISDIVNIGIGGSDLGPYMVTEALKAYKNHLNMHYVSNIDGTHISEVLKKIDPETTLFLIASKTFTTDETITNASSAKKWFLHYAKDVNTLDKHFFALSANVKNALNFGIHINNIFKFWDWVGGRFSLWSAAGLSIILSIGFNNFEKFLDGAHDMDNHFYDSDYDKNIPILLALISIWYANFFGSETEAILPYDQYMHRFSAYFQQSNMESNGKSINRNGEKISYHTGPIIWGEPGTNGQHAFYQLMHQGTKLIPCDFIAPVLSHNNLGNHHIKLISNFLAQTQALAFGKSKNEVLNELLLSSKDRASINKILPFYICEGNRPTNSILIRKINPYNLGALISLYEHKIFVQGYILNIYSFDQWGVEIGKKLSQNIFSHLNNNIPDKDYDSSTKGLIHFYKSFIT